MGSAEDVTIRLILPLDPPGSSGRERSERHQAGAAPSIVTFDLRDRTTAVPMQTRISVFLKHSAHVMPGL